MLRTLLILLVLSFGSAFAAGSDSSGGGDSNNSESLYKSSVSLIKKAGKLEKKDKKEKAEKLYSQAFKKLSEALKKDKKNPDILNYMGFTSRKIGNFSEAEDYYLKGLAIDPKHNGINEYLGELYVYTNRHNLAVERLEVLKGCNCEEYDQLKAVIAGEASKY